MAPFAFVVITKLLSIKQLSLIATLYLVLMTCFFSLSGGQEFTKLDLAHAYLQAPLEEESKKYTTINTHQGLYQYTRLPFGIGSAPAIFQRIIENILQGVPQTCIYLSDILLTGKTKTEHLNNLA